MVTLKSQPFLSFARCVLMMLVFFTSVTDAFQPYHKSGTCIQNVGRIEIAKIDFRTEYIPRSVPVQFMSAKSSSSSSASSEKKNDDNNSHNYNSNSNSNSNSNNNNDDSVDGDTDLFMMLRGGKENEWGTINDLDCVAAPESSSLYKELRSKVSSLEQGIGKRYRTRTRLGFLNIHKQPTDPFDTSNVVGKLQDGQIITATGPNRGDWILHDGGWSISRFQGFQWLESLQD